MTSKKAIQSINNQGILLVFPINNKKEPASLWSQFYPRSKMKWEWNDDGDDRVGKLWMLMKKLSASQDVVYTKWYQGRATFFSKELFTALLHFSLNKTQTESIRFSKQAEEIYEALENDSPLSTKQIKKITELQGKDNERYYNRAMKQLFNSFKIVAYGEVDDGAFPSLAVGTTQNLFEDLYNKAQLISSTEAQKIIDTYMPEHSLVRKFYHKAKI